MRRLRTLSTTRPSTQIFGENYFHHLRIRDTED
jgi:hypothetical protein